MLARKRLDCPAELIGPPIPPGGMELWQWFCDIPRQSGGFGVNALSSQEMLAWATLRGIRLRSHHVRALRIMDGAFLSGLRSQAPDPPGR